MGARRTVVALAYLSCLAAAAAGPAHARSDDRSKPVVYVHGLDPFGVAGVDCDQWSAMRSALAGWGHTGAPATIRYYEGDWNCSHSVDHHGSHSRHLGGSREHNWRGTSHTNDTRIEHLAYHLAWTIYDHFAASGQAVDVVGHSMGGVIPRYMLSKVGTADFPPTLLVEDVVTLGAPHLGTGWAFGCPWSDQCKQIEPGSSFIRSLAQDPQGSGGSDWTLVGSYDDGIVSERSAVGMDATHKANYLGSTNIGHFDLYKDTSDARDADVERWDRPGPWRTWYDAPHPVRWSDFALTYRSW